jgi:GAF domain-containing protein
MLSGMATSESARLEALYDYQILDTPAEEVFDAFTRLAATLCAAPMSVIGLVDEDRVWIKSATGLGAVGEVPRRDSFCDKTIASGKLFEVPDAAADARFAHNPLVGGEWSVAFYAGVPLVTRSGYAIGTLCVMDTKPRRLLEEQRTTLETLATAVMGQFDARRTLMRLVDASRSELYHFDLETQRIVFASEAPKRFVPFPPRCCCRGCSRRFRSTV